MSRRTELIILVLVDVFTVVAAFLVHNFVRFDLQWFGAPEAYPIAVTGAAAVLAIFWVTVFLFFGLYQERYAASRFDEIVLVLKAVSIGILILVFAIYIDTLSQSSARMAVVFYWLTIFAAVSIGRIAVRSVQKQLILRGLGTHRALVVGWTDRVEAIYAEVARYPEAGLDVVGAIRLDADPDVEGPEAARGEVRQISIDASNGGVAVAPPSVGENVISRLPALIDKLDVQDVVIALGPNDHDRLMEVLRLCDGKQVTLKLVPDFYSVIGGMARTEHMYGLPLIEVLPMPMPAWEQSSKRLLDVVVASIVLVVGLPAWLVIGLATRMTSRGPAIYRQQRVGRHGRVFTMLKFRTMHENAESSTGPVWATENDPRYTKIGRWLRKARLDEVPQFWNVLKGEMSLVGPRPERPYFVDMLSSEIPLYSRRHRVKPGITGWAQVKWRYDASVDDVRQKVKYDLFYIENMSLRMDFKILFRTIRTALAGSGR